MEIGSRIIDAALQIQEFCEKREWKMCFIGGLAVQRWGIVRATEDADLTLLTGFGKEESFIDPLIHSFPARHDGARQFALQKLRLELGLS